MITKTLQLFMLLAITLYFVVLFVLLKKKKLSLKYSLLWLLSGVLMLLLALFPQLLPLLSSLFGVYDPTNALFAFAFFCVLMILISLTAIASKATEQIKRLSQTIALLERRLREAEKLLHREDAQSDGKKAEK